MHSFSHPVLLYHQSGGAWYCTGSSIPRVPHLLSRWIRSLASRQTSRRELGLAFDLFHAVSRIHGRCSGLAVAVQAFFAVRRIAATLVLLQWEHLGCFAHSDAGMVVARRRGDCIGTRAW